MRHAVLLRAVASTTVAMLAFAGNSILCRLALANGAIDPASFTAIRLLSGVAALALIFAVARGRRRIAGHGSWVSAAQLFLYAAFFSFAYVSLGAATGALILFGFVQATMILIALRRGDRPGPVEVLGWLVATGGLAALLLPGVTAPSPVGALLMAIAGIAWGVYSIRGKAESDALAATTANFTLAIAFLPLLLPFGVDIAGIGPAGIALAAVSGALTSGAGYVIWYAALTYLTPLQAALVQLSVPALAAAGGVLMLAEPLSLRLVVSGLLILGGVFLALTGKARGAGAG